MNREDKLWREVLKPLASEAPEPDPDVEHRLLAAFRASRRRQKAWRILRWSVSLAAAAVAVVILNLALRPARQAPLANRLTPLNRPPASREAVQPTRAERRIAAPARKRVRGVRARRVPASAFFLLPYAAVPAENIEVLRVSLPRSAMSVVGLPVNPERMFDPVQADVAIGDDGVARAIRFVQ